MKQLFLFLLGIILLSQTACSTEEENTSSNLEIRMKGKYNNESLELFNKTFMFNTNDSIRINNLELFLCEIKLIKDNGDLVDVKDFVHLDFNTMHSNQATAQSGELVANAEIPTGSYSGIQLGVGLNSYYNSQIPGTTIGDELGSLLNFWGPPWNSYIFAKFEGKLYIDGLSKTYMYHTGADDMFQTITLNNSFNISEGNSSINLQMQIAQLFDNIDLNAELFTHSGASGSTAYILANKMHQNLANAISVE